MSNKIMGNDKFVAKASDIVNKFRTVYMLGCFGHKVTKPLIDSKAKQLPNWYTGSKKKALEKLVDQGYFGFDCVNLIKGILWGWNGDLSSAYGGAKYVSNSVPDTNADGMIKLCKDVSIDFSTIQKGEVVWIPGHIGIYIGGGKVIEATPSWENKVQITACLNIGPIKGLHGRKWDKHGKLPWIEYEIDEIVEFLSSVSPQILSDIRKWEDKAAKDSDIYWLLRKTKAYIDEKR
jgi:hypothetical protein